MRSVYNPSGLPVTWVVGREDHATSDVPEEWQGLPDYVLDDMELESDQ